MKIVKKLATFGICGVMMLSSTCICHAADTDGPYRVTNADTYYTLYRSRTYNTSGTVASAYAGISATNEIELEVMVSGQRVSSSTGYDVGDRVSVNNYEDASKSVGARLYAQTGNYLTSVARHYYVMGTEINYRG